MDYFIIYDLTDGSEVFRSSGPPGTIAIQQLPAGRGIVQITQEMLGVADLTPYLDALKLSIWSNAKTARDIVLNGGATVVFTPAIGGDPPIIGRVDTDDLSRSNITGAVVAAMLSQQLSQPFSIEWTLEDNSTIMLDAMQTINMGMSVVQHVNNAHANARVLRAAIENTTTVAELFQIDCKSGWIL